MLRNPFGQMNLPEVSVAETIAAKNAGTHQLVDIREQDERDAFRIAGTAFIPLGELAQRAGELEADRPVIFYCRSGRRSLYAVEILAAAGRADTVSMAGGIIAWHEAGYPIEQ